MAPNPAAPPEAWADALRGGPPSTEDLMGPTPESHSDFSALSETQYGKL